MNLMIGCSLLALRGIPRVSGDEPFIVDGIINGLKYSPRERG